VANPAYCEAVGVSMPIKKFHLSIIHRIFKNRTLALPDRIKLQGYVGVNLWGIEESFLKSIFHELIIPD
jgi:hypothetical protein